MTYARARLWLGIIGVGTFVTIALALVASGAPHRLFPDQAAGLRRDAFGLTRFVLGVVVLTLPLDVCGGFLLPRQFGRTTHSFVAFLRDWLRGIVIQSTAFILSGLVILWAGRFGGFTGAVGAVAVLAVGYVTAQGVLANLLTRGVWTVHSPHVELVEKQLRRWGLNRCRLVVVDHVDPGFTGGIVGLPGLEQIVLPRLWIEMLHIEQVALAVARRVEAIVTGSRTRGLLLALAWVLIGFLASASLPGAGVHSVAELVTTCCGFTCWSFVGLLVLPTLSRKAAYALDRRMVERGIPAELLDDMLTALDRLQDDEPQRATMVESIFHPVPSVANRRAPSGATEPGAWHVARMTLFLSWACMGMLARVVHCNAGRPELWVMLPTD